LLGFRLIGLLDIQIFGKQPATIVLVSSNMHVYIVLHDNRVVGVWTSPVDAAEHAKGFRGAMVTKCRLNHGIEPCEHAFCSDDRFAADFAFETPYLLAKATRKILPIPKRNMPTRAQLIAIYYTFLAQYPPNVSATPIALITVALAAPAVAKAVI
jgi:hypothetical protein